MDNPGRGDAPPPANDASPLPSPTDTRTPRRLEQPAASREAEGLSESFQSTDTVRRRPDAGYGTVASSSHATPSNLHYYSDTGASPAHEQAHHHRSGTSQSINRPIVPGTERGRSHPRKPPMTRRASSNAQAPHRGEVFSVDDALSEVEADQAGRHSLYNHPSSIRRRPARLHSTHSTHGEEDEEDDNDETFLSTKPLSTPHTDAGEGSMILPRDGPVEDDDIPGLGIDDVDDVDDEEIAVDDDDDDDLSDAESFTLKDRQQAINETHPFGIRLWKPALYKKDRSVQKNAEGDIHSSPGGRVSSWLLFFNVMWTLCFGFWLAFIAFVGAMFCLLFAAAPSGREYGRVLWGLAGYLFYPFGKFVRLEQQEAYLDEDQGEGRSISEYEQWQSGDLEYGRLFFGPDRNRSIVGRSRRSIDSTPSETDSLLNRSGRGLGSGHGSESDLPRMKRRLFGRGQWNVGRVIFFLFFYLLITPALFIVSGICWLLVFFIPMGRVTFMLFDHLRRHPLALSFESDISSARTPAAPHASIIVCTYRAAGLKYWKYTVDGTNIFLINLMAIVIFVIFDWLVLDGVLHIDNFLTSSAFLFVGGLLSIIPLAYFIGQAVASISAQSSMGVGAAINAFFSTIVEVFLYCVALNQGKAQLVEGSIVGSIFAGVLFLPGLSMCFGAIKRKTQRFNARSAGVTSTMLLFAAIAAFSPTLFYQIYGTHELNCLDCIDRGNPTAGNESRDCKRCYFSQTPAVNDRFYLQAVRPYCYVAASLLFLSYIIGLWFTLRTHAAVIWNAEIEEKQRHEEQQLAAAAAAAASQLPPTTPRAHATSVGAGDSTAVDIRDSHLYRRILGQSLKQVGLQPRGESLSGPSRANGKLPTTPQTPHSVPPPINTGAANAGVDNNGTINTANLRIPGFTETESNNLVHRVAEMAATAATIAARDARDSRQPRRTSAQGVAGAPIRTPARTNTFPIPEGGEPAAAGHDAQAGGGGHGGHDAPNWSRLKSAVILMGATLLYAIIAEILVDSVDFVLDGFSIDEKFLGITLFALVPNTTEFLNAISFAMNGNIALSMEIGSAYALQVCLLQIPALVLFSAVSPLQDKIPAVDIGHYTFTLLFPQWDMVTVILCVFLLSYMYGEGKSNYFKGSILLLSYLVVIVGYYLSGYTTDMDVNGANGMSRFDTMGRDGEFVSYGRSYKTVGRGITGAAY